MNNTYPAPRGTLLALLVFVALATALQGCTTYTDYAAFLQEPRPLVTSTEYRMLPPDVIKVTSKRVREINGHTEQVSPDGKITLPLLGTTYVAGRTATEVAAELEHLARDYYEDADVSVRVVGCHSKKVFVFGEVATPGPRIRTTGPTRSWRR